jgi:hypothetical protein
MLHPPIPHKKTGLFRAIGSYEFPHIPNPKLPFLTVCAVFPSQFTPALKMEAACSSRIYLPDYKTTRSHIPEDRILNILTHVVT